MAVLSKSKVPSGHWYRPDGTPVHKLPTSDGRGERPTTVRDAKRLGLYPSVTSILSILAKPGLEKWKAAYAATYWGPENIDQVLAANVFISTTEPGRMEVVKHVDLARDWKAFRMVAALWRYIKGYDPRQQAAT